MKNASLLLAALLFASAANAQFGRYFIFSMGAGGIYTADPGSPASISFPYTVTPNSQVGAGTHVFTGATRGDFHHITPMADFFHAEIFFNHVEYEIVGGLRRDMDNDWAFYIGYGFRYSIRTGRWLLRPGVDLVWTGRKQKIGVINNRGVDVHLLGVTSSSTFNATYSDSAGDNLSAPVPTDHIDVYYYRQSIYATPSVIFGPAPRTGRLWTWSLEVGYYPEVEQNPEISIIQRSNLTKQSNTLGPYKLSRNGNLSGPYLGFRIGIFLRGRGQPPLSHYGV